LPFIIRCGRSFSWSYHNFIFYAFTLGFNNLPCRICWILLYIGASDILPEAHSQNSSPKLIGLTILGALLVFLISYLA